jgi:hypothetical protein
MAGEAIDTGAIVAIKYVVGKFGNKITGMELSQETGRFGKEVVNQ